MKRLSAIICAFAAAFTAFAQTPEEIISRMEEAMNKNEKDGLVMTMDIKMPILGTISTKSYILGEKMRMVTGVQGAEVISWVDGETTWIYDTGKNEVEIKKINAQAPDSGSEAQMLSGITDGYNVSVKKETDKAWYILCKKSRTNKEKDDPKTMDLVVAKGTYYPISLSAKLSGVGMTLKDFSFGVTEKEVTFNKDDYPGVTVKDSR